MFSADAYAYERYDRRRDSPGGTAHTGWGTLHLICRRTLYVLQYNPAQWGCWPPYVVFNAVYSFIWVQLSRKAANILHIVQHRQPPCSNSFKYPA
ncbi:hypothetical protein SAMN05216378_5323 [Paenibacillus catalpae]|uniref:Uncharacterized protein n=1 Tax=Paenibacillus catalpae TaxID=1045775 RepID=A0A1I2GM67_9BACL|nr:hypothetical protein SAMN05216378_5323 [Paenibacillus catalpae]